MPAPDLPDLADSPDLPEHERQRRGIERAKLDAARRRRELGLPELPPEPEYSGKKRRRR